MNPIEVRALVAEILAGIAPEADLASVGENEDLREAIDLDSMDFMNLVIGLSQRSGRNIPDADLPKLFTLKGLVGYLAE